MSNNIDQQIGELNANVAILAKESDRARERDTKIFDALEALRIGQAAMVSTQATVVKTLGEHEVTLTDYKTMKTRGTALAFGVSAIAGLVGYWFEHVAKWVKG